MALRFLPPNYAFFLASALALAGASARAQDLWSMDAQPSAPAQVPYQAGYPAEPSQIQGWTYPAYQYVYPQAYAPYAPLAAPTVDPSVGYVRHESDQTAPAYGYGYGAYGLSAAATYPYFVYGAPAPQAQYQTPATPDVSQFPGLSFAPPNWQLQMSACPYCNSPQTGQPTVATVPSIGGRIPSNLQLPGPRDDVDSREISVIAWGARQAMATMYQNCSVLRSDMLIPGDFVNPGRVMLDPDHAYIDADAIQAGTELLRHSPYEFFTPSKVVEGSPYISQGPSANGCRDVSDAPPVFYVGRKAAITNGGKNVDLLRVIPGKNGKVPAAGQGLRAIDCWGFQCAALHRAGVNLKPNSPSCETSATGFSNMQGNNSCFQPATFEGGRSIRSGDILAFPVPGEAFGHSMMIESVGPDPFALSELQSASDCVPGKIKWENFDFIVIQSSVLAGRMAATRMQANHMLYKFEDEVKSMFLDIAARACLAKFSGGKQTAKIGAGHGRYALQRFQDRRDECWDPNGPATLAGEGCLASCPEARRGEPREDGDSQ